MENTPLTPEQVIEKFEAKIAEKTNGFASSVDVETMKSELSNELDAIKSANKSDELQKKFADLESSINAIKENAKTNAPVAKKSIKDMIVEKADALKKLISQKSGVVSLSLKAKEINPPALGTNRGEVYGQLINETFDIPYRSETRITDLFRRTNVDTEYIKYREQKSVTRDAGVVVNCATNTTTTDVEWQTRTVQIAKVRDYVDVCIDMMDDYSFVTSEIENLVSSSIRLKADSAVLAGTSDIVSIDSISSVFDPANVLAPFTGAFSSATLAELTGAMKAQIYTFGQEMAYDADTIIMNYNDWVKFMHAKNSEGDYLLPNFVANGDSVLNGMQVITSPMVSPNSLYVLDSTKGQILDRQGVTVDFSYENNDNFEHEIVTVKALQRIQFFVPKVHEDAFMKCTDIATALTAITK
jgi:HK97 family phage major capsid protein